MRATKKNKQKKHRRKKFFLFREMNFFSECFFNLPKLNGFFSKIGNNSMGTLARKKHMFFLVMRCLNLNREKKHSGLRPLKLRRLYTPTTPKTATFVQL